MELLDFTALWCIPLVFRTVGQEGLALSMSRHTSVGLQDIEARLKSPVDALAPDMALPPSIAKAREASGGTASAYGQAKSGEQNQVSTRVPFPLISQSINYDGQRAGVVICSLWDLVLPAMAGSKQPLQYSNQECVTETAMS